MELKIKLNSVNDVAMFVKVCERFEEDIDYKHGRYVIDAKSIMGILSTTIGDIALVNIITDNNKVKEVFKEKVKLWVVE